MLQVRPSSRRLFPSQKIWQEPALVCTTDSVKCSTSLGMSAVLAHKINGMCLLLLCCLNIDSGKQVFLLLPLFNCGLEKRQSIHPSKESSQPRDTQDTQGLSCGNTEHLKNGWSKLRCAIYIQHMLTSFVSHSHQLARTSYEKDYKISL